MIPPSLLMIIYGVLAEQSIGKLFIAGVLPGILLALLFAVMILLLARFAPGMVYDTKRFAELGASWPLERVLPKGEILSKLVPIAALVFLVIGGLYSGFFTPTEAGGVGAFGALVIAVARRQLNRSRLWRVLKETGGISVGILILLIAAGFYSRMLSVAGIPVAISDLVQNSGLGLYGFLAFYILIIVLLGMILDSSSILLIMTPVAAPIAAGLGMNLIHFGVITVLAVEIGLLTPPFGLSIFTVKSTLNDPSVSVESIFAGAFPYVVVMLITVLLIVVFPQLTLALL